jgi:hypothetical protein
MASNKKSLRSSCTLCVRAKAKLTRIILVHEIEKWIDDAAHQQGIPLRKLLQEEAVSIQREVTARYVNGSPHRFWWWNLKRPIDEHYDRKTVKLSSILPTRTGACWLILDTEAKWLPVYEIDAGHVERLIDDCPGFEYYVVALNFSWLVVETHHDQYYLCRESDDLPEFLK